MVVLVEMEVEGEKMYARSKKGISKPCLAMYFVVCDGLLRLLLTWLISRQPQRVVSSASEPAELRFAGGGLVPVPQYNY